MKNSIEEFAKHLQCEQRAGLLRMGYKPELHNHLVTVKFGRKFARVDIGSSGRYVVDLGTGEILGIKAYGVPHPGHRYGTLGTVADWDWSDYTAVRKPAEVD